MKIAIGCDHAGYEMKLILTEWLGKQGYEITNFGADSVESMDYPDVVHPLALPGRFIDAETGVEILKKFLDTPFEGGRHQRRIDKVAVV